jgi:hypothetical protein
MDIDELLAKHPAPWTDTNVWFKDANGVSISETTTVASFISTINAYASMKAERDALLVMMREAVEIFESMRGQCACGPDYHHVCGWPRIQRFLYATEAMKGGK